MKESIMMNHLLRLTKYCFLALSIIVFSGNSSHKFYVSISQIDVNSTSNTLEISIKVFSHDLEDAVYKQSHKKLLLGSQKQDSTVNEILTKYLNNNIILKQEDDILPLKFIGFEIETDIVWLYIESKYKPSIADVLVHNSLIMELFEDQKNIVNFRKNGLTKSQICTKNHPEYSFKI